MTHYKSLLESDWLGQWDLQRPDGKLVEAVVQIASVKKYIPQKRSKKRVIGEGGKVEWKNAPNRKLDISFAGKRKHWLAGPVSQEVIAKMFGPKIEDWVGKKITLYVDPTATFGTAVTGGIRVRLERNGAKGPITEDALDNAVDEEAARAIAEARDEFVGEETPEASP